MATPYASQFSNQGAADRRRGNQAEDEYLRRAMSFDARGAARESAGAMYEDFARELERFLPGFRGSQVGRGRLDTGYGMDEEDQIVREGRDRVVNSISQRAVDAEALNLRAAEGLGGYGERTTGRYLENLAGQRDAAMIEQERKRRDKAGLWGLGGRIAGTLLGPAGAVVGDSLADKIAGLFN